MWQGQAIYSKEQLIVSNLRFHISRTTVWENDLPAIWNEIEQIFDRLGFTSKNVCGSVADGSFTDGIVHTREWNPATENYSGYGILATDRFLEVNRQAGINVQQIRPEANLDFYLRKAAQSAYDRLRFQEIMDETSASHLILCAPWVTGSGALPWGSLLGSEHIRYAGHRILVAKHIPHKRNI